VTRALDEAWRPRCIAVDGMRVHLKAASLVMLATCGGSPEVPSPRFANRPAVWGVDDRHDVRQMPHQNLDLMDYDFYRRSFQEPLIKPFEVERMQRAHGINSLDEVPDSTWFTNRIGIRELTLDEIRRGPIADEGPVLPWTIKSTKSGGASKGLIIVDSRGAKYLIKFETPGFPEVESGADVVANRLVWACGYHVPEDNIVYFKPNDLILPPDAQTKNAIGDSTGQLGATELARELVKAPHAPDGKIRAVASRWLDGTPLGGTSPAGTRKGDPNDRIPHELRRDLRGLQPIHAWIDYVDIPRSNNLDMLVADKADPKRHYVMHYKIDFDSTLGALGATKFDARQGFAYSFDWADLIGGLFTVGATPRPWEEFAPHIRGVGVPFTVEGFDPATWKPNIPYAPFDAADRFDKFWGAKLVARFTRDEIHAAVEAGQYTDPRAVEYITNTLVARQHAIVAHWFARVNPLDHFTTKGDTLCFNDLAIDAKLASPATTHYTVTGRDSTGNVVGRASVNAAASGPTCVANAPHASAEHDGYTIVEIVTQRPGSTLTMFVHLALDPATKTPRVIGIWRV
jgi:hypothetical protein